VEIGRQGGVQLAEAAAAGHGFGGEPAAGDAVGASRTSSRKLRSEERSTRWVAPTRCRPPISFIRV
jgi:hypothetical protein